MIIPCNSNSHTIMCIGRLRNKRLNITFAIFQSYCSKNSVLVYVCFLPNPGKNRKLNIPSLSECLNNLYFSIFFVTEGIRPLSTCRSRFCVDI